MGSLRVPRAAARRLTAGAKQVSAREIHGSGWDPACSPDESRYTGTVLRTYGETDHG